MFLNIWLHSFHFFMFLSTTNRLHPFANRNQRNISNICMSICFADAYTDSYLDIADVQKFPRASQKAAAEPLERLFSGMMTSLTLIFSTWGVERSSQVTLIWCWGTLSDFTVFLEFCCYCFSSVELTYLNLILVYKSIWGFVFIFVSSQCSSKCKRLIHKSPS